MVDQFKKYIPLFKKYYTVFLFMIGILILLISGTGKQKNKDTLVFNESKYINELEQKISEISSMIDGAGECIAVVNITSTTESVYNKNTPVKQIMPVISGVTVICEGGNKNAVKESIISAVSTLLGIGSNKVCVIAKAK